MSRSLLKDFFLGMEEMEEQNPLEEVTDAEIAVEEVEVNELADDAEDQAEIVEGLEEVATGLEAIAISLESAVKDGGLDAGAAVFLHHAVKAHTSRLGMQDAPVASLESFGGATDRLEATQISMESVKDTLAKVWKAIYDAVMRAVRAAANLAAKIFSNLDKLEARAKSLADKAKALQGSPSGEVSVGGVASLHLMGKFDLTALKNGSANMKNVATKLHGEYIANAEAYYKKVADARAAANAEGGDEKIDAAVKGAEEKLTKVNSVELPLPGGRSFTYPDAGTVLIPVLSSGSNSPGETGKIKIPSSADLATIAGNVAELIGELKKKKDTIKKLGEAREAAVKAMEALAKSNGGDKGFFSQLGAKRAMSAANRDLQRPVSQFSAHAFTVSRATLSVVEKCINNYDGEKKDEKADEKTDA